MKKEDLKRLVDRPEMIPGIYNYCDRWCKHCHFTERCSVFAIEDEEKEKEGEINAADHLSNMFSITLEMILDDAKERGLDLEELAIHAEQASEEKALREARLGESELVELASTYLKLAHSWLEKSNDLLENLMGEELKSLELDLSKEEQDISLMEAIEAIRWYVFQIPAKIRRAVDGKNDDDFFEEDQRDSDGSAKVALIGIERSISAWKLLYERTKIDELIDILGYLVKIRSLTLKEFPKAPGFKRPGFDD